ncbi:hypothetical protein SAMN05216358_2369 [Rhizobium sp. AN5]|nr:hypothetical protein SAMN05216358_2369 [Rhizobium sp. AN5]
MGEKYLELDTHFEPGVPYLCLPMERKRRRCGARYGKTEGTGKVPRGLIGSLTAVGVCVSVINIFVGLRSIVNGRLSYTPTIRSVSEYLIVNITD